MDIKAINQIDRELNALHRQISDSWNTDPDTAVAVLDAYTCTLARALRDMYLDQIFIHESRPERVRVASTTQIIWARGLRSTDAMSELDPELVCHIQCLEDLSVYNGVVGEFVRKEEVIYRGFEFVPPGGSDE